MRTLTRAFTDADVEAAGRLLAARHRDHHELQPLLDPAFADPQRAAEEVARAWAVGGASGAVAEREGDLAAYVLGSPKPSDVWGPNMWVESAGTAGTAAEAVEDSYAAAAATWVGQGATAHYVVVPSSDQMLVDAWVGLGFGVQHVHAVRAPAAAGPAPPDGVVVRAATRQDIEALARLDLVLPEHSAASPSFAPGPPRSLEGTLAEWEQDWGDPAFTTWVAEVGGEVAGCATACDVQRSGTNSGLLRPDHAGFLAYAAVFPPARGLGVGRALGRVVLAWAGDVGHRSVATDWRSTNLTSARTWRGLGWEPTFLRLHRNLAPLV